MPRLRTIKPGFFRNEELAETGLAGRVLFSGLWCWADREGRLEDRPVRIRADVFPYDPDIDVDHILDELARRGFIVRYQANGERYIQIAKFTEHQNPHIKEPASTIPAPDMSDTTQVQVTDPAVRSLGSGPWDLGSGPWDLGSASETSEDNGPANVERTDHPNQDAAEPARLSAAEMADHFLLQVRFFVRSVEQGYPLAEVPEQFRPAVAESVKTLQEAAGTTPGPPKRETPKAAAVRKKREQDARAAEILGGAAL